MELPNVEVMALRHRVLGPEGAEEQVRSRLEQPLAGDDPVTVGGVVVGAEVALEDRGDRLLDLEDQRVIEVPTEEQDDEATGPDRPHADHLAGDVDALEGLEEVTRGFPDGVEVALEDQIEHRLGGRPLTTLSQEVLHRHDQRWVGQEAKLRAHHPDELVVRVPRVLAASLGDEVVDARPVLVGEGTAEGLEVRLDVELGVPDVHVPARCEVEDGRAVHADALAHRLEDGGLVTALAAKGHRCRGGHALHVPVEGTRKGFVEVVQPEDQPAFGRGVDAEVQDVGIAAQLDVDLG